MKFYLDGIMFYLFRAIYRLLDKVANSLFHWISDRFGYFPDRDESWFDE